MVAHPAKAQPDKVRMPQFLTRACRNTYVRSIEFRTMTRRRLDFDKLYLLEALLTPDSPHALLPEPSTSNTHD